MTNTTILSTLYAAVQRLDDHDGDALVRTMIVDVIDRLGGEAPKHRRVELYRGHLHPGGHCWIARLEHETLGSRVFYAAPEASPPIDTVARVCGVSPDDVVVVDEPTWNP